MTTISFIGAGNMARALIGGLLKAGHPPATLRAADPFPEARDQIAALGIEASEHNAAIVGDADVVVLAVKPQVLNSVLADMAEALPPNALVLSIVAGIPLATITTALNPNASDQTQSAPESTPEPAPVAKRPIVRCMPNTPALLGLGITGMYANRHVNEQQKQLAQTVASAAGEWVWVDDEDDIDAVTAVSGSGPAYFFYLMEAMTEAGAELGLPRELAAKLTVATATGAAAMAAQPGADAAVLRQNVTSPGGTTERALALFDDGQLNPKIRTALAGAAKRSAELAREFGR